MKTFKEMSRDLDTQNVNKAIQHDWATHIKHPSLGEDFVKVVDHSLTEDGVIEEYYVTYTGTLLTIQANEVTEEHGGSHSHEKKPKKKKKWNLLKNFQIVTVLVMNLLKRSIKVEKLNWMNQLVLVMERRSSMCMWKMKKEMSSN